MSAIPERFGSGGGNISPDQGSRDGNIATALRDIADDLAVVQSPVIASPDATDLPSAITLLNEIKGVLNVIAGTAIKTTKA